MYATGKCVEQDNEQALHWYQKAADQGDDGAQERIEAINLLKWIFLLSKK